jgi:two-component system, chemotaxis family, sensor kinase CheA
MDELTREFLIESQEGLDRMERCLTDLEARPADTALIAEIFRSVHTIKGTTGFLGFKRLEKLAHAGENLLGLLRDGKLAVSAAIVTGLLHLLDGLRSILRRIEADGVEGDGPAGPDANPDANPDAALIASLENLQTATPRATPRPSTPRPSRPRPARKASARTQQSIAVSSSPPAIPAAVSVELPGTTEADVSPAPAPAPPADPSRSAAESTLRVDVTLLNRMMNLVGELVLTRNQVLQATSSDPKMTVLSRRLDMVTADLRESVMKARMQPVSNVFSKMPRMVRDLSQALDRRVRLEMEGQETELDKSLLEAIKDPLTHAVRNALDHGIESPAARRAAGKPPEGTLRLRAAQEGSHVIVEISDDGAGIDVEKVRAKAVERGLISAERAGAQSERELLQLIFLPGFSTASSVTNVSGRGVGMDVVRTNVERIGGKVEIDSRAGKGTTLRLRIPLTLAIIPALIVRSAQQSFALPQGALSELVHVAPEQAAAMIEWIEDAPLYRLRGKLLPLVFLHQLLGSADPGSRGIEVESFIAVLDADGRRFGLVVDGLADPEEIVVKPLSASLKGIGLYSGATVLGNGDLALILDPGAIALKAGVTLGVEEEPARAALDTPAGLEAAPEYLLVEAAGRRAAVLLADVLRIEQTPIRRVEYVRGQPVINFEGCLLPIDDPGGQLGQGNPEAQIIVVVCRDGSRHVGIVVSHVLDVSGGAELFEAGTSQHTSGVTLLKNCVTGIVRLADIAVLPGAEDRSLSGQSVEALQ